MKIQIFIPCFVDQLFPETAFNMVKVLEKAGCEVIYNEKQTCCGQPAFNAGFTAESCQVATKFLNDFDATIPIVVPSASCAGFIKNYAPQLMADSAPLRDKANAISDNIFEFSQFLTDQLNQTDFGASFPHLATYHDSCAALRECKIKQEPRILLSNVKGLELVEMTDNETCCGFGGTFAVKFGAISQAMGEQKVHNAMNTGAEFIISTDLSCLMQIDGIIKKQNLAIKTIHIADVLAQGW